MKPRSTKRARQEREYKKLCREIDKELQEKDEFVCFFTGAPLPMDMRVDHHHLRGRTGDLLTDKRWIVPCFRAPHFEYTHYSVGKLLKTTWYKKFLRRLKKYPDLYDKEIEKQNK